ncbi:MAG TPA: hemolysin family protein [Candidatus Omnitrophota bacterium]|nr:HlyC/CorC family transporter [Candidatus Omnitrophota bacterium]HOX09932.1 hemolysin family protein [Candidatus Omnitrophota bacterium]HRZ66918.1 hemolysin family protein [Candidatus Omnitrophota bacterium]
MQQFIPLIIAILVLLCFSAFFSMSETALISLSKIKLRHMISKGIKNSKLVHQLVSKPEKMITSILVGNNLVNTAISVIGAIIFVFFLGEEVGMLAATVIVTIMLLIFGEIIPKMFAVQRSEKVSLAVAKPINLLVMILNPVAKVFTKLGNAMIKLFGGEVKQRSPLISEEEIRLMIELGKEEGVVEDEERKMLHRIFEFGDTKVGEVMIPLGKVVSIDIDSDAEELLNLFAEEGHSRLPVYKGSPDNIVGIIYARDLLYIWQNKGLVIIPDLVHEPYFVQKDKRVSDLLKDFQKMRAQIAIVTDIPAPGSEAGASRRAVGLVTLEDLMEEIVGEIDEDPVLDSH